MTDLPDRILAAIEQTARIAGAAIEGPWRLERETRDVTDYWTVVTGRGFLMSDSDSDRDAWRATLRDATTDEDRAAATAIIDALTSLIDRAEGKVDR